MISSKPESSDAQADLKRQRREKQTANSTPDKLPPHSPEAERGILGCILIDPKACLPECIEKLKTQGDEFYDLRHTDIYRTLVELFEDGDNIDIITLIERLKVWGKLEQVGGIEFLSSLADAVPSAANLGSYLEIVLDKFTLRRMISTCSQVIGRIVDYEGEVDTLMDEVERDVLRISESRVQPVSMMVKELVKRSIDRIEESLKNKGKVSGLQSGFSDIDRMTGGFAPGDMIVIAARPSVGKTSLAMNIAENVAVTNRIPVGVVSLEMKADALVDRIIACRSRVNLRNIRDGFLAERDFPKITSAALQISTAPLYIDDTAGLSVLQIRAKARRWRQQFGIKLLVIDYLQLANAIGNKRKFENRQQEVSDISCGIKNLAKELGIPVIVLSQLNREIEREKNRKPRLSDLRESGSIEQDADVVSFLYKPKSGNDDDADSEQDVCPVNLLIAKQRNGPTGDVNLTFLKSITRFENAAKVRGEDVPTETQPELETPVPYAD
jgi:replicative DNA helicase